MRNVRFIVGVSAALTLVGVTLAAALRQASTKTGHNQDHQPSARRVPSKPGTVVYEYPDTNPHRHPRVEIGPVEEIRAR